ncbi:MAG TPA: Hsp20/alpha crystallin family protein [Candidatus Methylacidiphilales bacterium]|nr:Hsp20/alpha crystallin family protein [Candidatus Methylacidiphilales bacterium]
MTTATFDSNHAQSWKVLSACLAVLVAILIAAMGVESYFLYKASHLGDTIPAPPVRVPALPHPGTPTVKSSPLPTDDWGLPNSPLAAEDPWDQLNHFHQQMDQLFSDTFSQFPMDSSPLLAAVSSPNLDIREEKDHYTVRVDMPGASKESIKVNVEGRLLTISGDRTTVDETKDNDKVVRSERSMAQFVRTVELPGPVKAESVDAKYDNGVLTLTLPKADQAASGTQVPIH